MRILQAAFPLSWLARSTDTANSVYAFIAGATGGVDVLVDDAGFGTKYNPPDTTDIDADQGMLFWAKDGDTLRRGFTAVARSKGNQQEYTLRNSIAHGNLTICGLSWDLNQVTYQSKAVVALRTIIYNMSLFAKPRNTSTVFQGGFKIKKVHERPYQSLIDNLQHVSRDGMQVQRGAAVLVLPGTLAPRRTQFKTGLTRDNGGWGDQRPRETLVLDQNAQTFAQWGREFRDQCDRVTMKEMSAIVNELL